MTIKTRKPTTPDVKTTKTLSRARKPAAEAVAKAQAADIIDAVQTPAGKAHGLELQGLDRPVTGRGVFAVRTVGNAVSVESAFLEENGNVLRLPAVFPNREYALAQIDELRQIVLKHFDDLDKASK